MPIRTVRRRRAVQPEPSRRPGTVWPTVPNPGRAAWALLPLGCVLLGGATERWSEALMLLALGAGLLAAPPRASLGRGLNFVLGGLVLLSLTAFLPAAWFHATAWRAALTGDFGVMLPTTLSPQPWLSAESLVLSAAGLAWFYWMATVRWHDDERRHAATIFAGGTVGLAVLCLAFYGAGIVPAGWHSERGFGPFPNRNQTADFFAIGALPVLACARAAWRADHKPLALGWLAGWLAVAAAVAHSFSRAGMFLLFGTTAFYLVVETLHRNRHQPSSTLVRWRRLAMVASLVLVVGSGLLVFGGDTLGRLKSGSTAAAGNTLSDALRQSIYLDTTHLINASPWCGNGLNTFAEIFPMYRRLAVQNSLGIRHPESDWLWLAAELGWPAVALALAGVVLVFCRLRLPRHGDDRPLRVAAALGVVGFLIHSAVDVSAHRVGSGLAALFLLSLALPGGEGASSGKGSVKPPPPAGSLSRLFQGLGVVFLLVGAIWLLAVPGFFLLPGEQGVQRLKTDALRLGNQRDYSVATQKLTQALAWAPLDWQGYYLRASISLHTPRPLDEALADFRRARYLDPFNPRLPLDEARLWLAARQTGPAVSALREACRREPANAATMIRSLYPAFRQDEAFVAQFGAAARREAALTVAFAQVLESADSTRFIDAVLQADPDLQRLDATQKTHFFEAWGQRGGDPQLLASGMAAHAAWQLLGWRWWAEALVRGSAPGGLQQACGIAARFAPPPVVPAVEPGKRTLAEWQRAAQNTDYEPESALPLYRAQETAGDAAGALATLRKVSQRGDCPPYFHALAAQVAGSLRQWDVAWPAWQKYLQAVKANE